MEKEKVNDEKPDPENSLDFSEHFNQLELLETHGHLIPTGTQSLWIGNSDDDEEQDEKTEEWYQLQEKKMEKDPSKLLLWAAEKNRLTTVQRLLSERATHVNTQDEDKYTPLHRAAYSGHLDVVRELIAHGADVHAVTVDGWTPLHSACKWNNARVASFLLQHDADVNAQTKGLLTPLHLAAGNRDSKDTLELLLMNRYIKPGLKNSLEETAFDIARRTGSGFSEETLCLDTLTGVSSPRTTWNQDTLYGYGSHHTENKQITPLPSWKGSVGSKCIISILGPCKEMC